MTPLVLQHERDWPGTGDVFGSEGNVVDSGASCRQCLPCLTCLTHHTSDLHFKLLYSDHAFPV